MDLVVPVPDSGVPSAIGYAHVDVPYEMGIIRNHVGRTFIEPTSNPALGVKLKLANRAHIEGKRVVLVDDSIVRGTTSHKIVEMVRSAGAKEFTCGFRVRNHAFLLLWRRHAGAVELLAYKHNRGDGEKSAVTVAFISMNGLYRAMGATGRDAKAPAACVFLAISIRLTDQDDG